MRTTGKKGPGQYDPYMSALETYRAGGTPWREVVDQKAPRMVIRSNMNVIDHSYGLVDICRISEDADGGYEQGLGWDHWFTVESVIGGSIRAFYNGRVFWNDLDGLHVYRFKAEHATTGTFDYGQPRSARISMPWWGIRSWFRRLLTSPIRQTGLSS